MVTHEADLTQLFNSYFVNVASSIKEPAVHSDFEELQNHVESKITRNTEFTIPLTNVTFVRIFLTNLNKSTDLDNIAPRVLMIAANVSAPSLTFIVNKNIISGEFPCSWKEAKVKPLFKFGAKDDVNNYRPISILPPIPNLIETWIDNQFMTYLNTYFCLINLKVVFVLNILQNLHLLSLLIPS